MDKLIIIDGYSIFFRAFYATSYSGNCMHNSSGFPTNALYVLSNILLRIIEKNKFTHALVALDSGKKTFRHDICESYKANRKKIPDELIQQINKLGDLLEGLGFFYKCVPGYEADDIIGSAAKQFKNIDIEIYSSDKDLLQLISSNVSVISVGTKENIVYDRKKFIKKFEIYPEQFIDYKALIGDPSDNIPGIRGIGSKTAIRYLKEYTTLQNIYKNLDRVSKSYREKFLAYQQQVFLSKKLATIHTDLDLQISLDTLIYKGINFLRAEKVYREIESKTILKRIHILKDTYNSQKNDDFIKYSEKLNEEESFPQISSHNQKIKFDSKTIIYIELDCNINPVYAIILTQEKQYYFTWDDFINNKYIVHWLQDETSSKIVYDSKLLYFLLYNEQVTVRGIKFDIILAMYIVSPAIDIKEIADLGSFLGVSIPYKENIYECNKKNKIGKQEDKIQLTLKYLKCISKNIRYIYDELYMRLNDSGLLFIMQEIELPIAHILVLMEMYGIKVDRKLLIKEKKKLESKLEELKYNIQVMAGKKFNISSSKQLSEVLFNYLRLPIIKKNKSSYSTEMEVLEKLKPYHNIIPYIIEYRKLSKIYGTYVKGLLPLITSDNRIHTIFRQTQTQTGRLSSVEPNLQNIPVRTEEGRNIRRAFIADENSYLVSFDYSQIELRILALMSNSTYLLDIFSNDRDIHAETAVKLFNLNTIEDVTSKMRNEAKTVNFGILYGISDYGLANQLNISKHNAQEFIDRYFEQFPDIKIYMNKLINKVRKNKYAETMIGRRRYFYDIDSKNLHIRKFNERAAINMSIQGTASDIIKLAMIKIYMDVICKYKLENDIKLILQIHDELIFNIKKCKINYIENIKVTMENILNLAIPLKVNYSMANNWYSISK